MGVGRSPQLLQRWMEMNAFTGLMRTHEGLEPKYCSQVYDKENLDLFRKSSLVFTALKSYRMALYKEASETGRPVVRHPMLHYFDDPKAQDLRTQFMLGADFMVAPVTKKNQTEVDAYLPKDEWVHLWTGEIFDHREAGASVKIEAPMGEPAVFYRRGSAAGEALRAKIVNGEIR